MTRLIVGSVLGAILGAGAAYATVALHLMSPDNVLAGYAMGSGGVILGTIIAGLLQWKVST